MEYIIYQYLYSKLSVLSIVKMITSLNGSIDVTMSLYRKVNTEIQVKVQRKVYYRVCSPKQTHK